MTTYYDKDGKEVSTDQLKKDLGISSFVSTAGSDYLKNFLSDNAKSKAFSEISTKFSDVDLAGLKSLSPEQLGSLSLETQDYLKSYGQEPNFFQKNAGMISAGADVLGGLAALYGTYKQGQLLDTQRAMAENELAFNKERQANFRKSRSGFNSVAGQPKSAFL